MEFLCDAGAEVDEKGRLRGYRSRIVAFKGDSYESLWEGGLHDYSGPARQEAEERLFEALRRLLKNES